MEKKKQTILEWYRKNHSYIDAPCGGKGNCGRCKVQFLKNAPEATEKEEKLLAREEIEHGIRLACMTEMTDETAFEPVGETFDVVKKQQKVENDVTFGIALDIGTTTLQMRLAGLESGKEIATIASMNHQRAYGADVLSRIQAANEGKLLEMQSCIQKDIAKLLEQLVLETQIDADRIKKIVIAGNTTMLHLLSGYSCEGLGREPFQPVSLAMQKMPVRKLLTMTGVWPEALSGLKAEVTVLPGISAFVGADIVAGMYECDMDLKDTPHMLLDIGTNGEIAVGDKNGFIVTSTAAGPVFEGGNISCGMPAAAGAITHINRNGFEILGEAEPQGLCGSGLVDLVSFLLEENVIDENGTLCDAYFESGYQIDTGFKNRKIVLTQSDIRELQMGKAAIRAGIDVLEQKVMPEKIYLAGGFGVALDEKSAGTIGLFPKEQIDRIVPRGNTALEGAHKFLSDKNGEERVKNIVRSAKEIALAKEADFEEKYIRNMQFEK